MPGGGGDSAIKQIMRALDKGPSSLNAIDKGLRTDRPAWEILLDVDALAAQEGENWVWQGASVLRPGGYRQALVHLSRGGADAGVVREFDIATRGFVPGGFYVPEAKTDVGWIDADRIYVGTDFGPGSLTSSGYPRLVKEWHRGTPLSEAALVFEGKPDDVGCHAFRDPAEGFERDFVVRNIEFYRTERSVRTASSEQVRQPIYKEGTDQWRQFEPWIGPLKSALGEVATDR